METALNCGIIIIIVVIIIIIIIIILISFGLSIGIGWSLLVSDGITTDNAGFYHTTGKIFYLWSSLRLFE